MKKFNQFCQSCGIPLEKDPLNGGTNSDKTKSKTYCSYCFENGRFKDNFKSSKEIIQFVRNELKKQGYPFYKRWFYTSHISQLDRWKKQ